MCVAVFCHGGGGGGFWLVSKRNQKKKIMRQIQVLVPEQSYLKMGHSEIGSRPKCQRLALIWRLIPASCAFELSINVRVCCVDLTNALAVKDTLTMRLDVNPHRLFVCPAQPTRCIHIRDMSETVTYKPSLAQALLVAHQSILTSGKGTQQIVVVPLVSL